MKEMQYFPFMRNHYYYGKFLSSDSLELEQKYINNKRRFINRFLHGSGVLFGMTVLRADDQTIAVQPGAALDHSGREIIIDKPLLLPISSLEGGNPEKDAVFRYLCLEYDEYLMTDIYSHSCYENGEQYENISESYRFYLTSDEPDEAGGMAKRFYEQTQTVYTCKEFTVKQTLPVMVLAGGEALLQVIISRRIQNAPINFNYKMRLTGMKYDESSIMTISYDSYKVAADSDIVTLQYPLHVLLSAKGEIGSIEIVSDSFLKDNVSSLSGFSVFRMNTEIETEEIEERLIQKFRDEGMRLILQDNIKQPPIYLARLLFENENGRINLKEVVRMPFSQYICSDLTDELSSFFSMKKENKSVENSEPYQRNDKEMEKLKKSYSVSSGIAEIQMPFGGKTGQKFFSSPIAHGLGVGQTAIIVGFEHERETVYGNTNIFSETGKTDLQAEIAVKADKDSGTFIIGIQLKEPTATASVKVHWTAIHTHKEKTTKHDHKMMIIPSIASVRVMESITFEVKFEQMPRQQVQWRIAEGARGGVITEGGHYTAPNTSGVYQIIAKSAEAGIQAVAFVAVRSIEGR